MRKKSNRIFPFPVRSKDPEDTQEFQAQVAAEPSLWNLIAEAHPPTVKIENEIFPRPHEIYNCTTCARGRELPQFPKDNENYNIQCRWDGREHIGRRWNDTGCEHWDRKIDKPKRGYFPGVESGGYDPLDRR